MKTVFKQNDEVFDASFGFGEVIEIKDSPDVTYPIIVKFGNDTYSYTLDGKRYAKNLVPSLSFTEYDYVNGGFSQERREVLPNRGDVVWVKDREESEWICAQFMCKEHGQYKVTGENPFNENNGFYNKFLTTINPYLQ